MGGTTWLGTRVSGSEGPPYSIEIQDVKVAGDTVDFFKVTVAGEDGGDFPSFPGGATLGANPSLRVEFRDESTDGGDPPDYLDSTDLKCVSQSFTRITAARGSIQVRRSAQTVSQIEARGGYKSHFIMISLICRRETENLVIRLGVI